MKAPNLGKKNIKNLNRNENKFIIKKINRSKNWFFERTKKLDQLQARLIKKTGSKGQQLQLKKIRDPETRGRGGYYT